MSEHHDDLGSGEPAQNPAEVEPADRGYRLLETWDPPRWVLVALFGAGGVLAVATLVAYGWNHPSAYVAARNKHGCHVRTWVVPPVRNQGDNGQYTTGGEQRH